MNDLSQGNHCDKPELLTNLQRGLIACAPTDRLKRGPVSRSALVGVAAAIRHVELQVTVAMKSLKPLVSMVTNSQRSTDLLVRIFENLDNQSNASNERLDKLFEAANNQVRDANAKFDQLILAGENQSSSVNARLDQLIVAGENQSSSVNGRLDQLMLAEENQSSSVNDRLDQLISAGENQSSSENARFDQLIAAGENQSSSVNARFDQLIAAGENQSSSVNARLDQLIAAGENQSSDVNARLDQLILGWNNQSSAVNARLDQLIRCGEMQLDAQRALADRIHDLIRSPESSARSSAQATAAASPAIVRNWSLPTSVPMNDLAAFQTLFDAMTPWSGFVPKGYLVDFMGVLTDARFRAQFGIDPEAVGGEIVATEIPPLDGANGEWWFETVNWFAAAEQARERFVMITLGACYGAQAVGAHRALQLVNPMPCKLVAVEGDPENYSWLQRHFRDNGIDPADHWLVPLAVSDGNSPVFFPAGSPGSGANNCFATNDPGERRIFVERLIANEQAEEALRNLMLRNTTGIIKDLLPGQSALAEVKSVSAITLRDLLGPFDMVDYLEADIQQSEILVFPPYIELLRRKVRRIHIGTHGKEIHWSLHEMFAKSGWEIVFSYEPDAVHDSSIGRFLTNDGVLTVRNPDL